MRKQIKEKSIASQCESAHEAHLMDFYWENWVKLCRMHVVRMLYGSEYVVHLVHHCIITAYSDCEWEYWRWHCIFWLHLLVCSTIRCDFFHFQSTPFHAFCQYLLLSIFIAHSVRCMCSLRLCIVPLVLFCNWYLVIKHFYVLYIPSIHLKFIVIRLNYVGIIIKEQRRKDIILTFTG